MIQSDSTVAPGSSSNSEEHWIAGAFGLMAEWGLYAIAVLVPLAYLPGETNMFTLPKVTALRLLTLLVLAAFLSRGLVAGRLRLIRTPLDLPLAAFLGVGILATIFSISINTSILGVYRRGRRLIDYVNPGAAVLPCGEHPGYRGAAQTRHSNGGPGWQFRGAGGGRRILENSRLDLDFLRVGLGVLFEGRTLRL